MRRILGLLVLMTFAAEPALGAPRFSTRSTSSDETSGFLLEPALAYSSGVLTQDGVADIATQAAGVEVRAGYKFSSILFGLSYQMGFGTGEQYSNKGDFKPTDMGGFLGVELPASFKLYGSYLFNSTTKIQSSENPGDFSGQGLRFGLSFSGLSFVTVMLESTSRTYTTYEGATLRKPIKDSTVSLSLSFPFIF